MRKPLRAKKREFANTVAEEPKLFVTFTEENHKENVTSDFMLQWEGNEKALTLLKKLVDKAGGDYNMGDTSSFHMNLKKNPISPTTIREISALDIGRYRHPITFCEGIIEDPPFFKEDLKDRNLAPLLDELFFNGGIADIFITAEEKTNKKSKNDEQVEH